LGSGGTNLPLVQNGSGASSNSGTTSAAYIAGGVSRIITYSKYCNRRIEWFILDSRRSFKHRKNISRRCRNSNCRFNLGRISRSWSR
jgi:hypothetical protein